MSDDKGLGTSFTNGPEPRPYCPELSNLGEISGDTVIGRGITARTSVILKSRSCDHLFRHLPQARPFAIVILNRAALALTRQQRGCDLRQAMEDRLEKLNTIARQ